MESRKKKFYVVLHNIRSCYNVGSVFRSADAFGATKIFLGGYTPDPGKDKRIAKTALGAEESVPWEAAWHTNRLLLKMKQGGIRIIAVEQTPKSKQLANFQPEFPCALVLGNEVKGLSRRMLSYCDGAVEIPMLGKKESLNVAVAFGIAAFHISKFKI